MSALVVRRLAATDLVDGFDAGSAPGERKLTDFFRQYALKNQALRRSVTWVAMDDIAIAGFVTLCPGAVSAQSARKVDGSLPGYPASVLVLARMATGTRYRERGVGRLLIEQVVMPRAENLASEHGCIGVLTEAKPEAVKFYSKHGFVVLDASGAAPVPMLRLLKAR
jgi:GNAT superfamily N-acetyltransferase